MTEFFVRLYRYFQCHKVQFYVLLVLSVLVMGLCCMRLRFDENINSFFPDTGNSGMTVKVFDNLKVSDRFVIMFTMKDMSADADYALLAEAASEFASGLEKSAEGLIKDIMVEIDSETMSEGSGFVYDILPFLLEEADYARIDSLLQPSALDARMRENRETLLSPAGFVLKEYILRDPLGIAVPSLARLSDLNADMEYMMVDGHIYSPDGKTLMCFVTPEFGMSETGINDRLVTAVEEQLNTVGNEYPEVEAEYFAGSAVGVYNARQIKKDTLLTSGAALLLIAVFIFFAFRRRGSIPLIVLPVLYGMLFSLCLVSLVKGSISAIAVGTGAVVLGIALSYSIHLIAHQRHVRSVEQLIRELVFPLTVGSLTTIGAFLGLLFTSSALLRDFGLFASMTLVGTTIFSLVFLPHFLSALADTPDTPLLRRIERINGYSYEKNRWVVLAIAVVALMSFFTSSEVGFNADMMSINYMPEHLDKSRQRLESMAGGSDEDIMLVSVGSDFEDAVAAYSHTDAIVDSLVRKGLVEGTASAGSFIISPSVQASRLERWDRFWSGGKKEAVKAAVGRAASEAGFKKGAFDRFSDIVDKDYGTVDYTGGDIPLLDSWVSSADSLVMLVTHIRIDPSLKSEVYGCFNPGETVIFDRSYFAGSTVKAISDDFNLILYISSFLIFFVLWISYGRLELAVLSFLPMLLSWIVIIGLMGLTGMQFNIVNIIISTFIFGIGDDFSIFIMDGLINRYSTRKEILSSHKTAIFFSTFTIIAGMGAMIAARHPALHSIGALSIIGMCAVVLISFTLQPLVFDLFVLGPASKGRHPYTFTGVLCSGLLFLEFLIACLLTTAVIIVLLPLPVKFLTKQRAARYAGYILSRAIIYTAPLVKVDMRNPGNEDFSKPCILVANHQSFLDVLWIMALSPRLLVMAKGWVRKVPVFWPIARFLGFYYSDEGYEEIAESYSERVRDGWSLAVFPEGTRETDRRIHRFHKGAFYIASTLDMDILPVVFYGNDRVLPKHSPMNMGRSVTSGVVMDRISPEGRDYRTLARMVRMQVCEMYRRLGQEWSSTADPYYRWALLRSMIYKGAGLERETRRELRRFDSYREFDELLPRKGRILHLGCDYGQIDLMLKMLSPDRHIVAVDGDPDRIEIARNNYLVDEGLEYVNADPGSFPQDGFDAVFSGLSQQSIKIYKTDDHV